MHKLIISTVGQKGGVSKTTTAHLLCHGLAKFRIRSLLLTTDHATGRKSLNHTKRQYTTLSGQTDESLKNAFLKFEAVDVSKLSAAMVVDGGCNRPKVDNVLAKYSNLVLLPFRDSKEDLRVVMEDMKRLPTAFALPSAWPTNEFAKNSAKPLLEKMEAEFPGRILNPVPACRATQKLLDDEEFLGVDSTVTSIAKNLVFDVLSRLDINPYKQ